MSFAVTSPAADPADEPIENAAFWPEIDPAQIRETQRIDSTITAPRLRHALIEAITTVNDELAAWRTLQQQGGYATLAAVPAEQIAGASINTHRYLRAIGCFAKASLIERYRDFDTTARGDRKADVMENPIDDLRRDGRWSISDILGIGRSVVELI